MCDWHYLLWKQMYHQQLEQVNKAWLPQLQFPIMPPQSHCNNGYCFAHAPPSYASPICVMKSPRCCYPYILPPTPAYIYSMRRPCQQGHNCTQRFACNMPQRYACNMPVPNGNFAMAEPPRGKYTTGYRSVDGNDSSTDEDNSAESSDESSSEEELPEEKESSEKESNDAIYSEFFKDVYFGKALVKHFLKYPDQDESSDGEGEDSSNDDKGDDSSNNDDLLDDKDDVSSVADKNSSKDEKDKDSSGGEDNDEGKQKNRTPVIQPRRQPPSYADFEFDNFGSSGEEFDHEGNQRHKRLIQRPPPCDEDFEFVMAGDDWDPDMIEFIMVGKTDDYFEGA